MSQTRETIEQMYQRMIEHFGPQGWWPGDGELEICVGAILTQNTNWTNVQRAINQLTQAGAMDLQTLHAMDHDQLAQLIRPAGYYNVKARRLKHFFDAVIGQGGDLVDFLAGPCDMVRQKLLAIKGIGNETADSMLLYAGGQMTFVVDAYTARILGRHGLIAPDQDYHSIKDLMESNLPPDAQLYNEYHALIVAVGKHFCKPKPACQSCPLNPMPHQVPVD